MSNLCAQNLIKQYGDRNVVDGVSLNVSSGEIIGLLGPNGAGKTTSFYMIVGLVSADKGEILIDGKAITDMPMHARAQSGIGYLPQEPSIF
ncbi:MAG: lipopolysaccharide ABC transporter ATP-binding protein, partial [Gammaproteobacteria bacterium]